MSRVPAANGADADAGEARWSGTPCPPAPARSRKMGIFAMKKPAGPGQNNES